MDGARDNSNAEALLVGCFFAFLTPGLAGIPGEMSFHIPTITAAHQREVFHFGCPGFHNWFAIAVFIELLSRTLPTCSDLS
jgi:hypothetical protein